MPTRSTIKAADSSTYIVNVAFKDENSNAVVPSSVSWTLSDDEGTIINNRTSVTPTPASSVNVVLTGSDLKYSDGIFRVLTIEAKYDSSKGSNLHLNDQITFEIEDLLKI